MSPYNISYVQRYYLAHVHTTYYLVLVYCMYNLFINFLCATYYLVLVYCTGTTYLFILYVRLIFSCIRHNYLVRTLNYHLVRVTSIIIILYIIIPSQYVVRTPMT